MANYDSSNGDFMELLASMPPPDPNFKPPYTVLREKEYPDFRIYLDAIVKGDTEQLQAYIDACNAVKLKYTKEEYPLNPSE